MAIQPELTSGESILWAGQPNPRTIFHKADLYLIPFSLFWGGFAIFWEGAVLGYWGSSAQAYRPWTFGAVWGIPFVLIGQYIIWGRFFYTRWKKKQTHYAVTNRRVIVIQSGMRRQVVSAFLDTLPAVIKRVSSRGSGTLNFQAEANPYAVRGWNSWDAMVLRAVPVFVDIDDVDSVYRLIYELREKSQSAKAPDA